MIIVDRAVSGGNGPVEAGMALLLLLDNDCLCGDSEGGCSCSCGLLRSTVGLELCGLPFRRGVFDLDWDGDPPLNVSRGAVGLRLESRPRCCCC